MKKIQYNKYSVHLVFSFSSFHFINCIEKNAFNICWPLGYYKYVPTFSTSLVLFSHVTISCFWLDKKHHFLFRFSLKMKPSILFTFHSFFIVLFIRCMRKTSFIDEQPIVFSFPQFPIIRLLNLFFLHNN